MRFRGIRKKDRPKTAERKQRKTGWIPEERGELPNGGTAVNGSKAQHISETGWAGPFWYRPADSSLQERKPERHLLRVAAYIRVSSESAPQEDSYDRQKEYFESLLSFHPDWVSAGVYSDYGVSAVSAQKRTGYNRLMRHCQEGRIDHIFVKSISRFSRNTRDFLKALDILRACRVTIAFEKEHLDTSSARNDMMLTMFSAVAQEESRSLSENLRWGMEKRQRQGEAPNLPLYGYRCEEGKNAFRYTESGYRIRNLVVCGEEAKVVRRIFEEAASGKQYLEIARGLNRDHIPAPGTDLSRRKSPEQPRRAGKLYPELEEGWTGKRISQIIRLERYAGDVRLGKTYTEDYQTHRPIRNRGEREQYYIAGHHPAIVEKELFEKVQEVVKSHETGIRTQPASCYPLSGKLICRHCGRFYHTRNRASVPFWQCATSLAPSGTGICHAEKIYESRLIKICQKAVAERFELVTAKESRTIRESLSGTCYPDISISMAQGEGLIQGLTGMLERVQSADTMEQDRSMLYRKIRETGDEEEKRKEWQKQLDRLERYWELLEADYDWRNQAICWMKSLPEGNKGVELFLDGLEQGYLRAFLLQIEVESPAKYRFCWFDDVWTELATDISDSGRE